MNKTAKKNIMFVYFVAFCGIALASPQFRAKVRFPVEDNGPTKTSILNKIVGQQRGEKTSDQTYSPESASSIQSKPPGIDHRQFDNAAFRLGGNHELPNSGYLQVRGESSTKWQLVCDPNREFWSVVEAQVACRQLGYEDGVAHTGHGGSGRGIGNLSQLIMKSEIPAMAVRIKCKGEEKELNECEWDTQRNLRGVKEAYRCNIHKDAIAIACHPRPISLCKEPTIPFGDKCYDVRGVNQNTQKSFQDAQADCQLTQGGHLVEIRNSQQNAFVAKLLDITGVGAKNGPKVSTFWTGGLSNSVAGKSFDVWFDSGDALDFSGFIQERTQKSFTLTKMNKVKTPGDNSIMLSASGIALWFIGDGDYTWIRQELATKAAYICENPQEDDIGCLHENVGASYNGSAKRGDSGRTCLEWSTPGLQTIFEGQTEWRHNLCRNPGGLEESPICFIDKNNYDYCTIPKCGSNTHRRHVGLMEELEWPSGFSTLQKKDVERICKNIHPPSQSLTEPAVVWGNMKQGGCSIEMERFQCKPGEHIFSKYICDGDRDCSDGEDEAGCISYLDLFRVEPGFKLQYPDDQTDRDLLYNDIIDVESCAKLCAQTKLCACNSFSYNNDRKKCLLSNRYAVPFDALVERKNWSYYRVDDRTSSDNIISGCNRVKRPASSQIEGLRLLNGRDADVVEVKVRGIWGGICDDGFTLSEANVICRQLGFELGAETVVNRQGKDVDDIIQLYGLRCYGNETNIMQCQQLGSVDAISDFCGGHEKAGLRCRKTSKSCNSDFEWHCISKECIHVNDLCDGFQQCADGSDENPLYCDSETAVRLVNPSEGSSAGPVGRVEIKHKGIWGTVCDDHFGQNEAAVVCKMLGFDPQKSQVYNGTEDLSAKSGPIWVRLSEDNNCKGHENSLSECKSKDLWNHDHYCKHNEDVAIKCGDRPEPESEHSLSAYSQSNRILPISSIQPKPLKNIQVFLLPGLVDCGKRFSKEITTNKGESRYVGVIPRIRGGEVSRMGEHPWQASIRVVARDRSYHWCGAAIISHFHVVTAAHCLKEFPLEVYLVRVGDHTLDRIDQAEMEYTIESIENHEDFNLGKYLDNDISIAKIKMSAHENQSQDVEGQNSGVFKGFEFSEFVYPICLPPSEYDYDSGVNLTITGWGKNGYEDYRRGRRQTDDAKKLQEAKVPIINTGICTSENVYGMNQLSNSMFCAGLLQGGPDACQGDSGGPAVTDINGRATLMGITSWGHGCGRPNHPGVYTKVSKYIQWIEQKVNK